jgi:signal transduction histidine kinase
VSLPTRLWVRLVGDRPIVTRLVVAVAAAMTVVLVATSGFVYWRVSFALDRQVDQDLDAWAQVVERDLGAGERPPTQTPGQTYQVYDVSGRLVGGNRSLPRLLDRTGVRDAPGGEGDRFDVGRFLPPSERAYRVVATRLRTGGRDRVVVAAISRHKHDEALRELLLQLLIADTLTLAAASFVGYRTARAALDPVERYRRAAETAGEDEVGRLPVDGRDDELTRLGHTFNDLLARIEASAARERQFLADASHELRGPLALISTELEWFRHRPRSADETATVLASLESQVTRLVALANTLLDLEELRSTVDLRAAPVRLPDLLADAVRGAVPAGTRVWLDVPDERVCVDGRWLAVAVGNLVANAVRHGAPPVTVTAVVDGDLVEVSVTDHGPGFPPGFLDTAFDRFSRAEPSRSTPGSGLGLALVRAVAVAHGGSARIDDSRGGARVVLEVRTQRGESPAAGRA